MAFSTETSLDTVCSAEDFCLPGLELQHEMLFSLKDWSSIGGITERLSQAGAEVHALSLNRTADLFVLRCRVKSISAARARAFVHDLGSLVEGAASVEHLMLAKPVEHAA
jgi:hypothetical protein